MCAANHKEPKLVHEDVNAQVKAFGPLSIAAQKIMAARYAVGLRRMLGRDRVETWLPDYLGIGLTEMTAELLRGRLDEWNATL